MAVMEFRDPSWWSKRAIAKIGYLGVAFCSVDAPELHTKLVSINDTTYLRLHGSMNSLGEYFICKYSIFNSCNNEK